MDSIDCTGNNQKVKKKILQFLMELHLRAAGCHLPYGSHSVTCHPTQVNTPALTLARQARTRFTYPGGMAGWVEPDG